MVRGRLKIMVFALVGQPGKRWQLKKVVRTTRTVSLANAAEKFETLTLFQSCFCHFDTIYDTLT